MVEAMVVEAVPLGVTVGAVAAPAWPKRLAEHLFCHVEVAAFRPGPPGAFKRPSRSPQ
jgi:hypothetical protein